MRSIKILLLLALVCNTLILYPQSSPVTIDLKSNGSKLDAKLYLAGSAAAVPAVILLHGFPGNQVSPLGLAEKLSKAGLNVLVFNYTGSYSSEGTFSFDNSISDVGAAYDFLTDPANIKKFMTDTSRIIVCGYSFGGTIAIESGMYNKKIRNIIAIGNDDHSVALKKAAADSTFRKNYMNFVGSSFGPEGPFRGDITALFEYFMQNSDRYDLVRNAELLKGKHVLFIIGWQDRTSVLEVNTLPLYRKLLQLNPGNTAIIGFESDHSFSNVRDELAKTIVEWVGRL